MYSIYSSQLLFTFVFFFPAGGREPEREIRPEIPSENQPERESHREPEKSKGGALLDNIIKDIFFGGSSLSPPSSKASGGGAFTSVGPKDSSGTSLDHGANNPKKISGASPKELSSIQKRF